MLGKSVVYSLMTYDNGLRFCFSSPTSDGVTVKPHFALPNVNGSSQIAVRGCKTLKCSTKKWILHSTIQVQNATCNEEENKTWEACKQAVSAYGFSNEEVDKMLGKAFGQVQSPYWGEERKKIFPKLETIEEVLDFLRTLSLSDDDLSKVLKKFPEVLGCNLEQEMKTNVQILEEEWGVKGKSLRNLLLRNPRVLGYNVDCKGDCIAQCTRCWARF